MINIAIIFISAIGYFNILFGVPGLSYLAIAAIIALSWKNSNSENRLIIRSTKKYLGLIAGTAILIYCIKPVITINHLTSYEYLTNIAPFGIIAALALSFIFFNLHFLVKGKTSFIVCSILFTATVLVIMVSLFITLFFSYAPPLDAPEILLFISFNLTLIYDYWAIKKLKKESRYLLS